MRIKIEETLSIEKEIDVEFPIYREDVYGGDYGSVTHSYMRVEHLGNRMREVDITITGDNEVQIEIDDNYQFDTSSLDYLLGKGFNQSSQKDFDEAVESANAILAKIRFDESL